jgi:hypothetical protein
LGNPIISNEVESGAIIDSDKTRKTKYIVIGLLVFILLLFLSFSYVIYKFVEYSRESNSESSGSTLTANVSSSSTSSASIVTYKDFVNQFVTAKIPTDANPKVEASNYSGKLNFDSLTLIYRNLDIYIGSGCLDTNCQAHTLKYDLKSPNKISWQFENYDTIYDAGETITKRSGSTTLSKIPEKYLSEDGNYLFLYSDEFKKLDNKKISNFLVFMKKDGKYEANTSNGTPSFVNRNNYFFEIKCTAKNKDDFNLCSEASLKLLETFKVK